MKNINPIRIAIIAYEGCTSSMVFGPLDILMFADTNWKDFNRKGYKSLFEVDIVTASGKPVKSFNGHLIYPNRSITTSVKYDLVYIPGFVGDAETVITKETKAVAWLKKQFSMGVKLTAACNGNFLLAETGIMTGKKATTHWSLVNEFRKRYPKIALQPEKILIDQGSIISAAGVTAYQNLALTIVERYGSQELSSFCAKVFLVDAGRKIQTPYIYYNTPKKHGDDVIVKVQDWMEANFKDTITAESIMEYSRLGKKTLTRRFKKATGDTPLQYLQRLRIENAKRLMESTTTTFNEVTWQVGYNDVSSFQKLFKTETGLSPREYRMKFSMI